MFFIIYFPSYLVNINVKVYHPQDLNKKPIYLNKWLKN
jgi:hypothetical protein